MLIRNMKYMTLIKLSAFIKTVLKMITTHSPCSSLALYISMEMVFIKILLSDCTISMMPLTAEINSQKSLLQIFMLTQRITIIILQKPSDFIKTVLRMMPIPILCLNLVPYTFLVTEFLKMRLLA